MRSCSSVRAVIMRKVASVYLEKMKVYFCISRCWVMQSSNEVSNAIFNWTIWDSFQINWLIMISVNINWIGICQLCMKIQATLYQCQKVASEVLWLPTDDCHSMWSQRQSQTFTGWVLSYQRVVNKKNNVAEYSQVLLALHWRCQP